MGVGRLHYRPDHLRTSNQSRVHMIGRGLMWVLVWSGESERERGE